MQKITKEEYIAGILNSIADKYPELRLRSKGPTFALQYMGTAYTLHKRTGFSIDQATKIEKAFHELTKYLKNSMKRIHNLWNNMGM